MTMPPNAGPEPERAGLSDLIGRMRPPVYLPPPDARPLLIACRRILDRYDVPAKTDRPDAERILADMNRRITEWDWARVPLRLVNEIARIVYGPDFRDRADAEMVRHFLVAEIGVSNRAAFLNHMVKVYVECFAPGATSLRALGRALQGARPRIGPQWHMLTQNLPTFLDADRVADDIAARMEGMEDPWQGLRSMGLRQPHAPGLMDAVHIAFLKRIAPRLDRMDEIARLLGWIAPAGTRPLQAGAGAAINALVAPWIRRQAPDDIRKLLIDRLTEVYSHPRVRRHAVWNEVEPAHERIVLRWLMGLDMRFLFRVLAEVERGHMWQDREDFWWTMLERDRIDELWIAFNGDGHAAAMAKLPPEAGQDGRRFGRQIGERDKSLLIMRIGQKIVVEGTYNFKVHIFDADSSDAPQLYASRYDVDDIRRRRQAETVVHNTGIWKTKVLLALAK